MVRLVIVGGGRMGEALLAGLLRSSWAAAGALAVVETDPSRREALADQYPGVGVYELPMPAEGAVLATKPNHVTQACKGLSGLGSEAPRRVLSIAAGVTTASLESLLPAGVATVRAMPNTAALVGAGAAAIAGGSTASEADLDWAAGILDSVGTVTRVPENLLDAVTGLSGSGPAYLFLVAEALIDAGVFVGLPRDVAVQLTLQTILGAARLLTEVGDSPTELRAAVTSPGGTTAAGLRALEDAGVRAAILRAVSAATERARELG